MTGTVKWFDLDKGYGFAVGPESDVFIHIKAVRGVTRLEKSLYPGDIVEMRVQDTSRGPRATDIEVLKRMPQNGAAHHVID